MSNAELLLATQLDQAGIPYVREFRFAPPRRWRADFRVHCTVRRPKNPSWSRSTAGDTLPVATPEEPAWRRTPRSSQPPPSSAIGSYV